MQNTIVKMTRAIVVALSFVLLGVMPALAQDDPFAEVSKRCSEMFAEDEKLNNEEIRLELEKSLKNGFDINERFHNGITLFHVISMCHSIKFVSVLLQAGAKVNARDTDFGYTPLHFAAGINPDSEVITALVVAGSDVNARTTDGRIPLHLAAQYNKNPEVIMLLLKAGSVARLTDREGKTPFDYAKENDALKNTDAYWALNDAKF